ncbi:CehA/McbA family metallohydrolase [Paenibacillus tarimensis]|uniref:CehA/McbA family metallohydrolase n=1 Tax=Paenibacillus tarimensis TaxID=416012 RepID=UPI001F23016F|nr:CehA/McbA family metallohydrolase [Paenibacillus tarimensis]MCF2943074.1 CehA/McbA family metallohydrolase [Paenibacillus tarimensis]
MSMQTNLIKASVREELVLPEPKAVFYPFEVNDDAQWLQLEVRYEHALWLQILVRDPHGRVRMQVIGKKRSARVALGLKPEHCSIGSVPGPLTAGSWQVELVSYSRDGRLMIELDWLYGPGEPPLSTEPMLDGTLWMAAGEAGTLDEPETLYAWQQVSDEGARFYKGDFHMHTLLSDGKQTPGQLHDLAASRGLDYIVVTEHNAVHAAWPHGKELLVVPGVEVTAFHGHCNLLGLRRSIELYDPESGALTLEDDSGMMAILEEARSQGAVCSLNHPFLVPWHWQFEDTRMALFDAIEIWNDPTYDGNAEAAEKALAAWDQCWAHGIRLAGIGGSDTHMLPDESYTEGGPPSIVGDPATLVWCNGLSPMKLLDGVRRRRCYVTRGVRLQLDIRSGGVSYLPGDELQGAADRNERYITLDYIVRTAQEDSPLIAVWIENGQETGRQHLAACDALEAQWEQPDRTGVAGVAVQGSLQEARFTCSWPQGEYRWLRMELRRPDGELVAFVNPVFAWPNTADPAVTWGRIRKGIA